MTISIIDYSIGNLSSISNMIKKVGGTADFVSTPDQIRRASKLILPGVGSFDAAMVALRERRMVEAIHFAATERGVPIVGICLGMQLLTRSSEEGDSAGLALVPASTVRFRFEGAQLPIPN